MILNINQQGDIYFKLSMPSGLSPKQLSGLDESIFGEYSDQLTSKEALRLSTILSGIVEFKRRKFKQHNLWNTYSPKELIIGFDGRKEKY